MCGGILNASNLFMHMQLMQLVPWQKKIDEVSNHNNANPNGV